MARHGKEPIPEGTLDLTQLSKSNSVPFKIPSVQWLKDNGWLDADEAGPVFIKRFDLFPLPNMGASQVTNRAFISLDKNVLNGETITFDRQVNTTFSLQQHYQHCFTTPELPNPYDVKYCPELHRSCRTATGEFSPGKIYPSLVGSEWTIKFTLPGAARLPFPKTQFYLQVLATICNVKQQVQLQPFRGC